MSHALEGTPKPTVTLTEQANGQRIPRSMFIGHTVGFLILFIVIDFAAGALIAWLGSQGAGSFSYFSPLYEPHIDLAVVPPLAHFDLLAGNLIVRGVVLAAAVLVWTDLILRRRHDRGRSGIDGIIWMLLFVADQVLFKLDLLPEVVKYLDYAVYLGALYLFFVLVILPGNPHENRYGAVPKPD